MNDDGGIKKKLKTMRKSTLEKGVRGDWTKEVRSAGILQQQWRQRNDPINK